MQLQARPRSQTLDVVRGIAIIAVVGVHSFQAAISLNPEAGWDESTRGFVLMSFLRFGVELFFALSGWLIFSLYYSRSSVSAVEYWSRRFARIWPLWIIFSLLSLIAIILNWQHTPVTGRTEGESLSWLIGAFLLCILFLGWTTTGLWNVPAGGWSIQIEMGHYLLFWILRKRGVFFLLTTILIGYLSYALAGALAASQKANFFGWLAESWIRLGLYGTWPFFVFGGLAFLLKERLSDRSKVQVGSLIRDHKRTIFISAVILVLASQIPVPFGTTYEAVGTVLVLLIVALLINRFEYPSRGLSSIGKYSYFIYFMHFWAIALLLPLIGDVLGLRGMVSGTFGLGVSFGVLFTLSLALSWGLAIPSWRLLEHPILSRVRGVK